MHNTNMTRRLFFLLLIALLVGCQKSAPPAHFHASDVTGQFPQADFHLTDHNGKPRSLEDFRGKVVVMFFGYTHCPDVCPLTLAVFNQLLQQIQQDGKNGQEQMIFVSVDPARDTPQTLKEYVNYFNGNIIGVGGSDTQIKTLTSQLGIVYLQGEKSPSGEYYIQHSASIFLVDPGGRLVSIFSPPFDAGDIVAHYRQIRDFIEDHPAS